MRAHTHTYEPPLLEEIYHSTLVSMQIQISPSIHNGITFMKSEPL